MPSITTTSKKRAQATSSGESDATQPPLTAIVSRLLSVRNNMIGTGFYLGNKIVRENVQWIRDGRADRLVVKQRNFDAEAQPSGDDVVLKYPTPPPDSYEPAPLIAVARISARDFWLTADGGYRGPSQIWKSISEVKPSCAAECPSDIPLFKDDYIDVADNLRWLQDLIATPGFESRKGFFLAGNNAGARFKLRHVLFEAKGDEDEGEKGDDKDTDLAAESDASQINAAYFTIENWPTHCEAATTALESIKPTHRVIPIPAYDISGNLIKPDSYRAHLEGALVELTFNLTHWSIAAKGAGTTPTDVYTGDIVMIRVLVAPCATSSVSPKKRRLVSLFVDPNQPSTKRVRYA